MAHGERHFAIRARDARHADGKVQRLERAGRAFARAARPEIRNGITLDRANDVVGLVVVHAWQIVRTDGGIELRVEVRVLLLQLLPGSSADPCARIVGAGPAVFGHHVHRCRIVAAADVEIHAHVGGRLEGSHTLHGHERVDAPAEHQRVAEPGGDVLEPAALVQPGRIDPIPPATELDLHDRVIENGRGRFEFRDVVAVRCADQRRAGGHTECAQHRDEQQRLVFAIAVAPAHHGRGEIGTVRVDADLHAHIADLVLDEAQRCQGTTFGRFR